MISSDAWKHSQNQLQPAINVLRQIVIDETELFKIADEFIKILDWKIIAGHGLEKALSMVQVPWEGRNDNLRN